MILLTFKLNPQLDTDIDLAAKTLRAGGCIAFPTETVYGLGVDATSNFAVQKVFNAKGRPSDNPLIIHLHSQAQLELYCHSIPDLAYKLFEQFCPGPLTIVLPRRDSIASLVSAGLETVAVRFPNHPVAHRLLETLALPLAAPSANSSGRPSATTWQAVLEDLDGKIDGVLCGEPCHIGLESTVIDLTRDVPTVLRSGGVTIAQLRKFCPSICSNPQMTDPLANSPGLRHRHYQPTAKVVLVEDIQAVADTFDDQPATEAAYIGISKLQEVDEVRFACLVYCCDLEDYATRLFAYFRKCDSAGIQKIVCESVDEIGIGQALMDRLRRAAAD